MIVPYITQLTLTHFRNHAYCMIVPDAPMVALVGKNGAGKTNILEAISCLVSTRGLRRASIEDFLQDTKHTDAALPPVQHWGVHAQLMGYQGQYALATGNDPERPDKRIYRIDNQPANLAQMRAHMEILSLTPQMDTVFSDGTTARRRLLDDITSLFFAEYSKHQSIYDHAKLERKKLLMQPGYDALWCQQLEARMAAQMMVIASARLELCDTLNAVIPELVEDAFPQANLEVEGAIEASLRNHTATEAEQHAMKLLEASRAEDARRMRTHVGTHKSDFNVAYVKKGRIAQHCSTGEQKALLLTLLAAAAMARRQKLGYAPMLLLDEVVSHLDAQRRASLLALCEQLQTQCWFTGTDAAMFNHAAIERIDINA